MGYKEEQAILNQQVIGRSSLRTQKGEYKFKSNDQYKAKDAMKKLIQRYEKFEKEVERMQQQLERDAEKLRNNFDEAFLNIIKNAGTIIK